jgi:adenylate kinase family enzyme
MFDTKLIILDGLPGSGKSTTAQWLELQLQRNGFDAQWYWEGDVPHPQWWYENWTGAEYAPPD